MKSLRRILRHVALAGLPIAAGAGCFDVESCPPDINHEEVVVEIEDPPPERQAQIDACRDEDQCDELCAALVAEILRSDRMPAVYECELAGGADTSVRIVYDNGIQCGRRPEGFDTCFDDGASASANATGSASAVGQWFARAAELEAAAVDAFEQLARELSAHGAPAPLQDRAERAARDEVRHARLMTALAHRFGGQPRPPQASPTRIRPLLDVALDNAAEGCVRESYGASVAFFQARSASDPTVRAALATIAEDEASHAELSWDIERWFLSQAGDNEAEAVRAARATAVSELEAELDVAPCDELIANAGLPGRDAARAMFDRAYRVLWRADERVPVA